VRTEPAKAKKRKRISHPSFKSDKPDASALLAGVLT